MPFTDFTQHVTSLAEIVEMLGTPSELALRKELKHLDEHMQRFIQHSPFLIISTHGADGKCDASPRGDASGFVQVRDEKTLLIPDRRGNRRVDSLRNILETGRIGILFLVPGMGETLRINGRAAVIRDEDQLAPFTAAGQRPLLGIVVEVEECYLQCAKALLRSKLWDASARPDLANVPCAAEMFAAAAQMPEFDTAKVQASLEGAYQRLY